MHRRSRLRQLRRARRARPKPVPAQALPRRCSCRTRRPAPHRGLSAWPGRRPEAVRAPPEEAWAAARAASRARAARQRRERRRQEVAVEQRVRQGRVHPREPARWAVVQELRGLARGREAAQEPEAAPPTGYSQAAAPRAPFVAAFPRADRLRLPSLRPSPASQYRWRPDALTDRREGLCLGPTVMTGASWGCLYPANLEARRPRLALMAQDQDRDQRQPEESRQEDSERQLEVGQQAMELERNPSRHPQACPG